MTHLLDVLMDKTFRIVTATQDGGHSENRNSGIERTAVFHEELSAPNPDPIDMEVFTDEFEVAVKNKILKDILKKTASEKQKSDSSFYIVDLADVVEKLQTWRAKLPRVEPFYAVKCNPDPVIINLLSSLGLSFDCASKREIEAVLKSGASPSRIIYAHPYKPKSYLAYARQVGVDCMTFDCESELRKIKALYPEARLVIRFRVPDVVAGFPLNEKFGCEFDECHHLLEVARQLQLNVVGACFHVGGLCEEPEAYARALKMAREVFETARRLGYEFSLLDIGGGYPGHSDYHDLFREMCQNINESLDKYFPDDGKVRIIAEPGCYFACSAFTLCTKIIGKRYLDKKDGNAKMMYYLNDGFYMSFPEGIEKYKFKMEPLLTKSEIRKRAMLPSKLWGATCCSSDYIMPKCLLPEMEIGEHIIFKNMGAYTTTLSTNFNGFPTPSLNYVYLSSKKTAVPKSLQFSNPIHSTSTLVDNAPKSMDIAIIKTESYQISDDDSNSDICRNG